MVAPLARWGGGLCYRQNHVSPQSSKTGLNFLLNAKLRCDFSGGPPVKTGGFPACGGRRGLRPLGKILAQWARRAFGGCNSASDQRERRLGNRALARTGIQRPNVGPPTKAGGFPPTYGVGGGAFAPRKSPFGRWSRLWREWGENGFEAFVKRQATNGSGDFPTAR